jgi:hypothetical protein|tara:strand:+ start:1926 stop:2249 length:324 start_codon:yes stop_codon:yes gene_type:complete
MAATWSIVQLDYTVSLDSKTNVVTNIHWDCTDEDADGNHGRTYGSTGIPTDDLSDFIAYDDITEANAIAWVKSALGDDKVSEQEDSVAGQIAVLQTPVSGSGSPWAA